MHTLKFKNFSTHIVPVTNFLLVFLIVLSIIGFVLIFFLNPDQSTYQVSTSVQEESINEGQVSDSNEVEEDTSYKNQII